MLRYVLLEENKNNAIYEYFPEGKSQSGIIGVSKATGELNIIRLAETDRHRTYAAKLFRKLEEFQKKQLYNEKGMIAWF